MSSDNDDLDSKVVHLDSERERKRKKKAQKVLASLDFHDITATGAIRPTCANTRVAIGKLGITCKYDVFHDKLLIGGQAIAQRAGELSDHACLYLRKMIEQKFGFDPKATVMLEACIQLCLESQFDPIVDYLNGLEWDGVERINEWMTTYLGARDTKLNRAIGRIALIAQVRRARDPGCKFDQIIVLESEEGELKSSALLVLAGGSDNFSDQTILGRSEKEQQELLRGVWIYELADLSNIRKAEADDVKAFTSRTHDRARPAYGRCRVDLPRRFIFWGTTNQRSYLKSQTGNRRVWPVEAAAVRPIDLEGLKRDRNQLLAEAAACEADGESIVLPKELWSIAGEEQDQRREVDPWEDVLRDVMGTVDDQGEERVLSQKLFSFIGIPAERQKGPDSRRIGEAMRNLGWKGPKVMRVGEHRGRGFWRPEQTSK
jgi:predicted P-loop ATPase